MKYTGTSALEKMHELRHFERNMAKVLDCDLASTLTKAEKVLSDNKELRQEIEKLRKSEAKGKIETIKNAVKSINGASVFIARADGMSVDEMKEMADELVANTNPSTVVLLASGGDKANFVLKAGADLVKKGVHAGKLIKEVAKVAQGGGGGRPDMASAGGKDPSKIEEALAVGEKLITEALSK